MKRARVVVTGYGALTSLGENSEEIWSSILKNKLGYKLCPLSNPLIKSKYFAFLPENNERYGFIPKRILRALPFFAKNALVASHEAMTMAFKGSAASISDYYVSSQCGVILGTGWGGLDEAYQLRDHYRDIGFSNPLGSLISMPNIATAACTMMWNLRGYQNTINAACATGTIAIGEAYQAILQGRALMMLAGGSETLRNETNIWNIDSLNALSKEQNDITAASCPFDIRRSGFVLAEGAAVLCLEEMEHAKNRGAKIFGEITGYGNYSDASDYTSPAKDMQARINSIQFALGQADIKPTDIGYINAHGTSTQLNDINETNTIKSVFGESAYKTPISSTKGYSGHLISAAGSFESILCLKVLESNILPATANLIEKDDLCNLDYIPLVHRENCVVNKILNLSFGFGGANAALIIERFE
ncbi:3-oxoacyl-[acyl-carrier-protein] synthase 2 [Serratia quinivorans]|uniref:beta-ketoacyl-[acyl-carrier-protein] synthase family protein n=1 Tax=Serratia TaxID=613 RepID=UPI001F4C14B2|nr:MULTISPECIES: beta-ketoacyl-[acyl-carrier-protein] synthase family protein [Serratia]ULG13851.1 3-oxoacyl-ACP synthase [Serratia proteamaculans]ULG13993.1 3-oxoacyl-ACP synthase [Serratia proteamaculans]ULG14348.1 3-oxoacyl-ACP synthase [Serratia proteamaculans]ULG14974.1 3-oxoacyl-ACP synthase [Serratia proteamaculans]ULG15268.1 3-oxoacyl-ACP synthase [Serratia proteamaculans]